MNSTTLEELVNKHLNNSQHKKYFLSLAKPSVTIHITQDSPKRLESKFGGEPEAPENFQWPRHKAGDYVFIGQINFSEIIDLPPGLPQSGMLSLFYALDDTGKIFWGDDDYVLGYYWEETADLNLKKALIVMYRSKGGLNSTAVLTSRAMRI